MKRSVLLSVFLWFFLPFSKLLNRINWRFGRPYCCNPKEIEPIKNKLQPGMVILTHRNYECSSLFIPGYWTHAAIVVSSGQIIDATRKGVCINSAESFFSAVDDFIILKPGFCCKKMMVNAGNLASKLVGCPFSFDFQNSNRTFYCSGLVCWVYAQTLIEENPLVIPDPIKRFLDGYIVKPEDLYTHKETWEIMDSFGSFSLKLEPEKDTRYFQTKINWNTFNQ